MRTASIMLRILLPAGLVAGLLWVSASPEKSAYLRSPRNFDRFGNLQMAITVYDRAARASEAAGERAETATRHWEEVTRLLEEVLRLKQEQAGPERVAALLAEADRLEGMAERLSLEGDEKAAEAQRERDAGQRWVARAEASRAPAERPSR